MCFNSIYIINLNFFRMKKLLFLLLSAAVAVSASAGITAKGLTKVSSKIKATTEAVEKKGAYTRGNFAVMNSVPMKSEKWGAKYSTKKANLQLWDFEDEAQLADWTFIDNDGDGYNWTYQNNATAEKKMTTHSGDGVMFSESFHNSETGSGGTILYPDNWMISPVVELNGQLAFYACGQDASYCEEVFGVYVCIGTPSGVSDFVQLGEDQTATSTMQEYSYDLSEYAGQQGCIAIVHHNVYDMFMLNVDDVMIGEPVPDATVPEVNVVPDVNSAFVTWTSENAVAYDLRYRPYVDTSNSPVACDLNMTDGDINSISAQLEDWLVLDIDGDDDTWGLGYANNNDDNDLCWISFSYYYDGQASHTYDPDNWLISPEVKLQGVLKFSAWGQNTTTYNDNFRVYVITEDEEYIDDNPLTDDITTATAKTEYEIDLSSFNGKMGRIAFRHYDSYDNYWVKIDDVFIGDPNAEVIYKPEWIYVEDLLTDAEYTIEGLDPETEYEVEVQAYNEIGATSYWSDPVNFTTLAETTDLYIMGEVNEQGWAADAGTLMAYDEETKVYTATVNIDGRGQEQENYFSFTTKLGANADDWATIAPYRIGAVSEGSFWVTDEQLNKELEISYQTEPNAFRILGGEYKITVSLENMNVIIEKLAGPEPEVLRGDVNRDGSVTIGDVTDLIDHLLSSDLEEGEHFSPDNANTNLDESISIGDVTALIDFLLSGAWPE